VALITLNTSPDPSAVCFSPQFRHHTFSHGRIDTSGARLGQPNELYIVAHPDELCLLSHRHLATITTNATVATLSPTVGQRWLNTNL
jgi:hypothetical protein